MVQLTPQTARLLLPDGTQQEVDAALVKIGDHLLVKPGETVAVDGVIVKGRTSINQAVMTGESLPVDKTTGDDVFSGTVNQFGAFEMKATKVGEDSSIQRMIQLVQAADASKAKIVGLADRWAVWVVIGAAAIAGLCYVFTQDIIRSVTVLVVFCPCALVLATPTAIMAGIGNVTKHGFLVRTGDALERLSQVNRVMFDKTGTLTYGKPEVTEIVSIGDMDKIQLLRCTAAVENASEHPLGKAIVRRANKEQWKQKDVENFQMIPGQGVCGKVDGYAIIAGNVKLLQAQQIVLPEPVREKANHFLSQGSTVIYTAVDGKLAGFLVLTDTMRKETGTMVQKLERLRVVPTLLTGDNERSAGEIAGQAGIFEYHASCMPEDKIHYIQAYQEDGDKVCMIGDGINDAPSLKCSHVGIAMGGVGSDIAVDAADIVLVDDDVKELPHLFALSRHMMQVIKANLTFSMTLNFLAVGLAVAGILNPVWGALVHNAGSVFVIVNSSFLLKWEKKVA